MKEDLYNDIMGRLNQSRPSLESRMESMIEDMRTNGRSGIVRLPVYFSYIDTARQHYK